MLRNIIDITWAMFVTVCVVCIRIVSITRLSMAWLQTCLFLILSEFLEI